MKTTISGPNQAPVDPIFLKISGVLLHNSGAEIPGVACNTTTSQQGKLQIHAAQIKPPVSTAW